MKTKSKYKQGFFRPLNREKYVGDYTNIVYRSSWELFLMTKFDKNPDILKWSSESTIIIYRNPLTRRNHRYFPDVWIKKKDKNGKISEALIEIKPYSQTIEPKPQKQKTKAYINKVEEYLKNQAKWEAAKMFCEERDMEFIILTERELFTTK